MIKKLPIALVAKLLYKCTNAIDLLALAVSHLLSIQ